VTVRSPDTENRRCLVRKIRKFNVENTQLYQYAKSVSSDVASWHPIPRAVASLVAESLDVARITVVQGARQVGKSTLVAQLASARGGVLMNLDDPVSLAAVRSDPGAVVSQRSGRLLVIDEAQRAPDLALALKLAVDTDPRPGRFLVTGSSDLLRLPGSADSLAGRAQTVELHPFTQGELAGRAEDFLDRLLSGDLMLDRSSSWRREDYLDAACAGGFPEARARKPGRSRSAWWRDYLDRLLRRDAAEQANLQYLDRLPRLVRLLAARHTRELIVDRLAADVDLPPRTLPAYLDLLQRLYLLHLLPAWSTNLTRREIDRRRIHLTDSGLVAHLLGLNATRLAPGRDPDHAGPLLEGFATEQLRRQAWWTEQEVGLFHYRDYDQHEIDVVVEAIDGRVAAIEIKASSTVGQKDLRQLRWFADRLGDRFVGGALLHTGPTAAPFGAKLVALPIAAIWQG